MDDVMRHLDHVRSVLDNDEKSICEKEATYRGSWKKRGGVGAFMMLARKWDRLENMLTSCVDETKLNPNHQYVPYDIFEGIEKSGADGADGTVLAEVRDLRRYLVLVEAEMLSRQSPAMKLDHVAVVEKEYADTGAGIVPAEDSNRYAPRHFDDVITCEQYRELPTSKKLFYTISILAVYAEDHQYIVDRRKLSEEERAGRVLFPIITDLSNIHPAYWPLYSRSSDTMYEMRDEYRALWGSK